MSTVNCRPLPAPPPRSLWRSKDYVRWFASDALGDLGSSVRGFAVPLVALAVSGSATAAGVIGTATRTAYLCGLLPAGVIADRCDRKRLIVVGHLMRAVVFCALAVAWFSGMLSIWVLGAAAVCSGVMSGIFGLASDSAIKHVVTDEQLPAAAAANQARSSVIELVSSPLSGLLMSVSPALPFIGEAATHTLGAACVARIEAPMTPQPSHDVEAPSCAWSDLISGWAFLSRHRQFLILMTACALVSTSLTGFTLILPLSWRMQGMATGTIGLLLTASSATMLVGAAAAPWVTAHVSAGPLLIGGSCIHTALLLSCAAAPDAPAQAILFGVASTVLPVWNATASGYLMHLIPSNDMGRVMSAITIVNMALPVLAPILAGAGLDAMGTSRTLLAFASFEVASVLLLAASSGLRHLGTPSQWGAEPAE
nr:MFS transporter [Actinomyces sp.]